MSEEDNEGVDNFKAGLLVCKTGCQPIIENGAYDMFQRMDHLQQYSLGTFYFSLKSLLMSGVSPETIEEVKTDMMEELLTTDEAVIAALKLFQQVEADIQEQANASTQH